MSHAQKHTANNEAAINAACRAVYELQYNTAKAARYVTEEVAGVDNDHAIALINKVVRRTPAKRSRS